MDLKLQIHHPMIMYGQLMLWFPEGRVGSWMKSIFLMPDSDPVRNYSLNFKDQKEESHAKNRPILASRRLVQPMFQIILATRKLAQTLSAFLLHKRFFTQKNILTNDGKWKVIHAHSPDGRDLAIAVSKKVTRIVRHTNMSDNLTAQCIGAQLDQYCWKRLQNMEHEMSQESIGYTVFMKEAARQELSIVRIPQNP